MRYLALLATLALLPTGAFALSTSGHQRTVASPLGERRLLSLASPLHLHPWLSPRRSTLQTGATAVPTSGTVTPVATTTPGATSTPVTTTTPVTTATPVATGTATIYPDPVKLLQNTIQVYQQVRRAHFELITNTEQIKTEKLHLDVKGDVTCKGPSLRGHVYAKDTKEATGKASTLSVNFIIVKKAAYQKSKSTKERWAKINPAAFAQLGISADNLLLCPGSSSGSSSAGSGQVKDLVNLGPATFRGHAVWHVQAKEVSQGSSGQTVNGTFDLLIDQARYFPYESTYSATDQGVTQVQKQILTKFGEKLNIKAPKIAKAKAATKHSTKKSSTKKTKHKKKP